MRPIISSLFCLILIAPGGGLKAAKPPNALDRGTAIALDAKDSPGTLLTNAIAEKGPAGAVGFCNERAIPMTADKMKEHGVEIKRATDRPRNPKNLASAEEMKQIRAFKSAFARGEKVRPVVIEFEGYTHFYAPIVTNGMCLQCHGVLNQTVSSETQKAILRKYPDDKAVGYESDQLRGIWSIRWPTNRIH